MTRDDARAMLEPAGRWGGAAERWADLGCGTGTFTLALADLLGAGSAITAVDDDPRVLTELPATHDGTRIETVRSDLIDFDPGRPLDGVLIANALHYVPDPEPLLGRLLAMLDPGGRLLLVEYDTNTPLRPWVPYPIGHGRAGALLQSVGFENVRLLATRPSIYGRRRLYSMVGSVRKEPGAHARS